jgi:hypothetical protein
MVEKSRLGANIMNEQKALQWSKTRTMGKGKYVLYYGALLWGVLFTVLFGAVELLSTGTVTWSWTVIRLVVFAVVGFFIANARWDANERKYAKR